MAASKSPAPSARLSPLIASVLVLAALYFARAVLIPLSLAALFAFLLTPAVKRLETWRLGRIPSVVLVMMFSFLAIGGLGWIAANQLIDVLTQLPNYKTNINNKFEALHKPGTGSLAKARESLKELSKELSGSAAPPPVAPPAKPAARKAVLIPTGDRPVLVQLVEAPPSTLQYIKSVLGPLVAPVGTAIIVLVFAIVMLIKREDVRDRVLRLIGPAQLNLATEAFDDATQRVSRYLRLQFVVNTAYGILIATGLNFIGLPNALLWGVLAGVFRFVPYVGAIAGAALPAFLALAMFDSSLQPALCVALFLVIEPVVGYVIEPALYGTHTGISSLAILVAAAFWTTLWGPVGLVLSTPLTVCLVVLGRHVPHLEFLHVLLGDEPVLPPAAQLYQRLLAMDQQEAHAVITLYLKDHSVLELYDEVLIPALSMAEHDRHKGSLDETREQFLHQSLEEFLAELADVTQDTNESGEEAAARPETGVVRVVCLAASDKADEITAAMLAQVLELAGHPTISFPVLSSPADILEALSGHPGDLVCISALPPFALMKARSLSKQLRARFPELRIVIGLWHFSGGGANADERLGRAFTVDVVTTLAQAVERVQAPLEPSPAAVVLSEAAI
jgi:predicted PurR-regulated permease PerM/methanogenic corrinoid protein MtbC1